MVEHQEPSEGRTSAISKRRSSARAGAASGYQRRREGIVSAAATLFKDRGYARTSVSDIAEAVGVDRATLYYYISSKAEVLDEIVSDLVARGLRVVEELRRSQEPAPVKLRRLVVSLMESYAANYPVLYVYLQEHLSHVEEERQGWAQRMRAINRDWEQAVEDIVQEGLDDGSLRPIADAKVIAYGLIGTVSWSYRWYNPATFPADATSIGEAYADMLLNGLAADDGDSG